MRPALVALSLLALATPANAQALQRTRFTAPRRPAPPSSSRSDSSSWPGVQMGKGSENLNGEAFGLLFLAAGVTATSPFWLPHCVLGDDYKHGTLFPAHPYARPNEGVAERDDTEADQERPWYDRQKLKPWSLRLHAEDGNDFDGLNRTTGALVFDTESRLGLMTRWDHYHERLGGGVYDSTTLGEAYVTFRFAQGSVGQFHAGVGGRWRFDRHDTSGGVSFLYAADLFVADPLVLSGSVDLGNLDRQFVVRARASAGWQLGRCEVLGGYDFLRIGSVNLQGPFLGLRLWF